MANIVGMTEPYRAANGHLMVAPLVVGKRGGVADARPVASWAQCADNCPACAAGGRPSDWCGEEDW